MTPEARTHVDVLIVGAGLSGIGIACHLLRDRPGIRLLLLEQRATSGGTWDLFRYPGIRSDSDLYTYGYAFKPWRGDSIADGESILAYLRETAAEHDLDARTRFGRRVRAASWCSTSASWTVTVEHDGTDLHEEITCSWLVSAAGYYDHAKGHTPDFAGIDQFTRAGGRVVHPQHWPAELDVRGLEVVVIGSGATAVTLVPALAATAAHVTMLQRSPSYVVSAPKIDVVAKLLQQALSPERAHAVTRAKNIALQRVTWRLLDRFPRAGRRLLRRLTARRLPPGYPVDEHFKPTYDPWDQRLCAVPDGDLFRAISNGSASVVTEHIEHLTDTGILLASGRHLAADLIVTATGLRLVALGDIRLTVDGEEVSVCDRVAYRGLMLSGIPNLAFVFGYFFSSWTLKVDLVGGFLVDALEHMQRHEYDSCRPEPRRPEMPTRPMLDLAAGYVRRAEAVMPRQGTVFPWLSAREYVDDVRLVRGSGFPRPHLEPHLEFARTGTRAEESARA